MIDPQADAARLRQGWDLVHDFEANLGAARSQMDSVGEYLELRELFDEQLQRTAALFLDDRTRHLAALQAVLARLPGASEAQL